MKAQEIRTVFMGTPDFALDTLRGLLDAGLDLVGVFPVLRQWRPGAVRNR